MDSTRYIKDDNISINILDLIFDEARLFLLPFNTNRRIGWLIE